MLRASVTAKGLKVLERCDRNMDAIEDDMLDGLAPGTIDTVREALRSCAHSLGGQRAAPTAPAAVAQALTNDARSPAKLRAVRRTSTAALERVSTA